MSRNCLATAGVIAALGALGSLGATGCGDDSSGGDNGDVASGPSKASEPYDVTLVIGLRGDPYYVGVECGAKDVAGAQGVKLSTQGPEKWDPALETQVVNAVSASSPDGVAAVAADPVALYQPLKGVVDAGAKLVLYDGTLERDDIAESVVLSDNDNGGRTAAKEMAKVLGGKGKVLVLTDAPGNVIQRARADSFKDEATKLGLEIVGTEYAQGDVGKGLQSVSATIAREGDLAGVYATGGVERDAAVGALRQGDKFGKITLVAYGEGPQIDAVKAGQIQALISQRPREQGRLAVKQLIAALDGEQVKEDIKVPVTAVTKENLDTRESQDVAKATDC
jgi:ribose transport system substrate-binding protein